MFSTATNSITPLGLFVIRMVPVATTTGLIMCHYLQHLMFSSFLTAKPPAKGNLRVLPHLIRVCFWGIIPLVLVLEFASYGCLAANIIHRPHLRGWYSVGFACSISHLVNAPYAWNLLQTMMNGDATVEDTDKPELRTALNDFVRMNRLRVFLTEVPLMAIAIRGALVEV
ncbi:hypothetical protein SAMD00023353_2201140 [Rosellinia necatrix]|uniref:Uncharacterized protein n=1 Tax=Rosellinia necatrix TaxID=77044 RepID=A0A1S7UP10_ROSNE|nr:hypothetical protein SAMD00023353_2201140 [Rosellinia necatrix]